MSQHLFIGGPLDGQWIETGGAYYWRAIEMGDAPVMVASYWADGYVDFHEVEYRLCPFGSVNCIYVPTNMPVTELESRLIAGYKKAAVPPYGVGKHENLVQLAVAGTFDFATLDKTTTSPTVKTMSKLKYKIKREGTKVYFQVLEQDDRFRCNRGTHLAPVEFVAVNGMTVYSDAGPAVSPFAVYLRGSDRSMDNRVAMGEFANGRSAQDYVDKVNAALADWAARYFEPPPVDLGVLKYILTRNGRQVAFRVLHQDARFRATRDSEYGKFFFKASNGFEVASVGRPQIDNEDKPNAVFLRGTVKDKDTYQAVRDFDTDCEAINFVNNVTKALLEWSKNADQFNPLHSATTFCL